MRIVFASRNPAKAEQVARLLPGVELLSLDEVAPNLELYEPHESYEANALAKASAVVQATGLSAVADDSGLEVDALAGDPGVHSARWAGEGASDDDNNRKLVAALQDAPGENRTCRYRCTAALITSDGRELVTEGVCEGHIVLEPRGTLGFGYDPHVVPEGESRTMGEIPVDEKLAFTHRGRAFGALAERLAELSRLDEQDVAADPISQFDSWFAQAQRVIGPAATTMALATSGVTGHPSVRMVLLKGVDDRGFVFYTNYESRKAAELEATGRAALVLYWERLGRQVRVEGAVQRTSEPESAAYFASRPMGSRIGAWASRQSSVIESRAVVEQAFDDTLARFRGEVPRPAHWGGYRVAPEVVEFWQDREDRLHDRLRYRRTEKGWVVERLSP